jgi:hypothetical protein
MNGMYSGDAGGDESTSRDGGEVSVTHKTLGSKSEAFTVLVHGTESEAAVG